MTGLEARKAALEHLKSKSNSNLPALAAIIDDPDAIHLIAAWSAVEHTWLPNFPYPESPLDRSEWDWIWDGHETDKRDLMVASSVSDYRIGATINKVKALRLVYPDGTISDAAVTLCIGHVNQGGSQKRPAGVKQK